MERQPPLFFQGCRNLINHGDIISLSLWGWHCHIASTQPPAEIKDVHIYHFVIKTEILIEKWHKVEKGARFCDLVLALLNWLMSWCAHYTVYANIRIYKGMTSVSKPEVDLLTNIFRHKDHKKIALCAACAYKWESDDFGFIELQPNRRTPTGTFSLEAYLYA